MLTAAHFLTHIGLSWLVANALPLAPRDRLLVVLAGTLPDLDGIGILWSAHAYAALHRAAGHGLPFGALITGLALWRGAAPWACAALALVSFHLHVLLDLVGTGGLPIRYLWPLSDHGWTYDGHWVLASWPNAAVMAATALAVLALAWRRRQAPRAPGAVRTS